MQCAIRIQACIRSFLTRQRIKEQQRQEYDSIVARLQDMNEELITVLATKIIFFYTATKDVKRLVSVVGNIFPPFYIMRSAVTLYFLFSRHIYRKRYY